MAQGLLAPLSPPELSQLLGVLLREEWRSDDMTRGRFVALGLIEEKADGGMVITKLGKQRLAAEPN